MMSFRSSLSSCWVMAMTIRLMVSGLTKNRSRPPTIWSTPSRPLKKRLISNAMWTNERCLRYSRTRMVALHLPNGYKLPLKPPRAKSERGQHEQVEHRRCQKAAEDHDSHWPLDFAAGLPTFRWPGGEGQE